MTTILKVLSTIDTMVQVRVVPEFFLVQRKTSVSVMQAQLFWMRQTTQRVVLPRLLGTSSAGDRQVSLDKEKWSCNEYLLLSCYL